MKQDYAKKRRFQKQFFAIEVPMEQNETQNISEVLIHLMKGILYKEEKPLLWERLSLQQAAVRDYLSIINLDVVIHDSDGFAYLKNREPEDSESSLPKLVAKRPLSYPVSLILVLLRRRLTEHDTISAEARLIIETSELYEIVSSFLAASNNEVRLLKRFDSYLLRIHELGFIRFLNKERTKFEVKRILKAFIDAQWLADFDAKLQAYATSSYFSEFEDNNDD